MIPSHHCRAYRPTADLLTLVASFSGRCSNQELLSLSRRQSPQLLRPSRSTPISLLESAAAAPPAAPQPDPALSLQLDQRPHGPLLPYLAELSSFLENGYLRFQVIFVFYIGIYHHLLAAPACSCLPIQRALPEDNSLQSGPLPISPWLALPVAGARTGVSRR